MTEFHNRLPLHNRLAGLMTVAVLGLTASACSIEQSETVPEGQVVVVDGEHPSPTDELANRILKTSLATEAIAEGQDEPLVAAEMVGSRAVKTWSEGKRVAAKLPDLFKIELVTTGEIKDAQTAIPQSHNGVSMSFCSPQDVRPEESASTRSL